MSYGIVVKFCRAGKRMRDSKTGVFEIKCGRISILPGDCILVE